MKGKQVSMFNVGQLVNFVTNIGTRKTPLTRTDQGTILKLHKSGSQGSAEIRPHTTQLPTGNRKITRRLQHVTV